MSELEPTRTYSDSTATDELRRMLDERGVEWQSKPELIISGIEKGTEFDAADGRLVRAVEALDGTICLSHITPEQAIAATLGSSKCSNNCTNSERTETCHIKPWKMERDTGFYDCMECECGYVSDVSDWAKWHFCPNCGAKVVEPTTNDVDGEVVA